MRLPDGNLPIPQSLTKLLNEDFLDRIGTAIEEARQPGGEGPYGLFDYTNYGDPIPHHVRDFRRPEASDADTYGHTVFKTTDPKEAEAMYHRLTRIHIARRALTAIDKEMVRA